MTARRDDFLTTEEASHLLGVEARQIRALADTGFIVRVARGLFDRTSVERYRAERGASRTRTWTELTAWGAVAMLSMAAPMGLGDTQRYRLQATLRQIKDPVDLTTRLRDRAVVTRWSGHRSVITRLRDELVVPGRRRIGLVDDSETVDGYLPTDDVADLVRRYAIEQDPNGAIILRHTGMNIDFIAYLAKYNRTLAAVDAATSLDPRERGVGEQVLTRRLELFRENTR